MVGLGVIEHFLGGIGREDHPVCMLGQHRPEAPGTAGYIEDQARLASHLECAAHQLLVAPERQSPPQAPRSRLKAVAGMFPVVAPGELQFNGGGGLRGHVQ
ncbi:hypothetical protein D3C81_1737580 [compost metagenome]